MYTAMDVYHAPQMKNWRNIIVESFVRITASRCRDCEIFVQLDDDVRPRRQDDVRVLRLMSHAGAGNAADDSADDRALTIAADHPAEDRARGRSSTDLRHVTRGDPSSLVRRLERVDGRVQRVRSAAYSDARHAQRQGPRCPGIGRRF